MMLPHTRRVEIAVCGAAACVPRHLRPVCHGEKLSGVVTTPIWSESHPVICAVTVRAVRLPAGREPVANLQVRDHLSPSLTSDSSTTVNPMASLLRRAGPPGPARRSRRGSRFSAPQPTDTATGKRATHAPLLIYEESDAPGLRVTARGPAARALRAIIVETLHRAEIKHALRVRNFR